MDSDDLGIINAQCKRADDAYNGSQWTSLTKENYQVSTTFINDFIYKINETGNIGDKGENLYATDEIKCVLCAYLRRP